MSDYKFFSSNCISHYLPIREDQEVGKQTEALLPDQAPKTLATSDTNSKDTKFTYKKNSSKRKTKIIPSVSSKRALSKQQRNSGKEYISNTSEQVIRPERQMKSSCGETCKYKCAEKITEKERQHLFSLFWGLGDIEMQRQFLSNCMKIINPKYRYVHTKGDRSPRQKNNAFYFRCHDEEIRVCKTFFKNTLDINDRPIRTVLSKRHKIADHLLEPDRRGKHGNHPKLDSKLHEGIKQFINTLPRIKKGKSGKTSILKSKSIAALHKEYVDICTGNNEPFCNYTSFYRNFTENQHTAPSVSKTQPKKMKLNIRE